MAARRWQIEPYVGLADLRFGMTRAEVGKVLDPLHPVTNFDQAFDGSHREFRGLTLPTVTYKSDCATEFESPSRVYGLFLDAFEVFQHPAKDVMQFMAYKNGDTALAGLGIVLFNAIGISTSGFYEERTGTYFEPGSDQDERSVTVYAKGDFDGFWLRFTPCLFRAIETSFLTGSARKRSLGRGIVPK